MGNAKLKDDLDEDLTFADELAAGSTLMHGQYTIISFLNAGGFGITYSARDSLNRKVVIKECFPGAFCRRSTALVTARSRAHQSELQSIVRLFVQEARSLAKLDHPNIVGVHQVFEENNTAYMALDFVEGRDLLDVIEQENVVLRPAEVESILRKVLDAIGFVHAQGLLHRDISPDNILLDKDKNPVLIDFGAAREQATKKSRVLSALRVVKDGYSPQEFYISGSEQGPYSDLYALGASFYHLITGDLPPDAQTRLSAVASGEADPYRPLIGRIRAYDENFLRCLDMSMEILPKNRIPTAEKWLELLDSTDPIVVPEVLAKEPATSAKAEKPKSKKGLLLASVALVALAAMGVVAWQTGMLPGGTEPQPTHASAPETETAEAPGSALTPEAIMAEVTAPAAPVTEDVTPETAAVIASPADTAPAPAEALSADVVAPVIYAQPAKPETQAPTLEALAAPVNAPIAMPDVLYTNDFAKVTGAPLDTPDVQRDVITSASVLAVQDTALPQVDPAQDVIAVETAPEIATAETVVPEVIVPAPALAETPPALDAPADPNTPDTDFVQAPALAPEPAAPIVAQEDPAAETSAEDLIALNDTPAVDPVPTPQAATPAIVLETFEVPGMRSVWSVALPQEGRLFAVNGTPVGSPAAFEKLLHETIQRPDNHELTLTLTMGDSAETAVSEDWVLPVIQKTEFPGGLSFEAKQNDGAWETRVVRVPLGDTSGVAVGDVLFGHIKSTTFVNERTTLPELAERAYRGETDLGFAVNRDGNTIGVGLILSTVNTN